MSYTAPGDKNLNVTFKVESVLDEQASRKAKRPIYNDTEVCYITMPGNKQFAPVFPAHSIWKTTIKDGLEQPITYAMRFQKQYDAFKEGATALASGTPLAEMTSLPQGKRLELNALKIFTIEQLANLDDRNIKHLGMGGRTLKDEANDWLKLTSAKAEDLQLAEENRKLREELEALKSGAPAQDIQAGEKADEWDSYEDADLKALIKEATGTAPTGTPKRETLVRMLNEAVEDAKKKEAEQAA